MLDKTKVTTEVYMSLYSTHLAKVCLLSLVLAGCTSVNQSPTTNTPEVMETQTESMKSADTLIENSSAKQVAYISEAAAQAMVADGPVVYFFRASWCPTCQALQKELDSNGSSLPAGTTIVTVDYDNSSALKTKYAVTYQHTLVQIDATGKELAKWQGGGVSEIVKNIKI